MRKIIKGKVYDTSTAKDICSDRFSKSEWKETLFKKKTGEFFVLHENESEEPYITPITFVEAQDWALKTGVWEAFAEVIHVPEDISGTAMLGLNVSAYAAAKLKSIAMISGESQSYLLNKWILDGIKRFEEEERQHEEELKSYTNEELYEMICQHQDYEMVMEFCGRAGLGDHPPLCDDEWCWEAIDLAAKKLGI